MARPKEKKIVNQFTLQKIYNTDRRIDRLKEEIKQLEQEVSPAREEVIAMLRSGAEIEQGKRSAGVEKTAGQRRPKYKEILEQERGKEFVEQIIKSTEPSADSYKLKVY
jgi:hypothetical protein